MTCLLSESSSESSESDDRFRRFSEVVPSWELYFFSSISSASSSSDFVTALALWLLDLLAGEEMEVMFLSSS